MKTSILLYLHRWNIEQNKFNISEDLYFENIKHTSMKKLYKDLCINLKIDDADPFDVDSHIVFDECLLGEDYIYLHTPHSIVSKLCNILAICSNIPVAYYRIIMSEDDFKTYCQYPIEIFYEYELLETLTICSNFTPQIEETLKQINRTLIEKNKLTNDFLSDYKLCYDNYDSLNKNRRMRNAINFFFNSWHSHQMEHVCINLAIVLESLFSPYNAQEITHQIAFNFSHFMGKSRIERENIYDLIKKFYSLRSKIVHGSDTKFDELYIITSVVFVLCCELLKNFLMNLDLARDFNSEDKRQKLFKKFLFD